MKTIRHHVLDLLEASPHALTAAQIAFQLKHDSRRMKYVINDLCHQNLVHVVGIKKIYGSKPNLYAFGPAPKAPELSIESLMAPWIEAARAKLEQRA